MWFNPKMPDAAPRRPRAQSPKAVPVRPFVRQLAAACSAVSAGELTSAWSYAVIIPSLCIEIMHTLLVRGTL